ncbi:MAG: hypothetical protein KC731_36245 [Myxococcales bacterium]|nr:hypothetical protein [Myxococcales bacterium]
MTPSTRRQRLKIALVVANLAMLALPTISSAGGEDLAAGLAIGCCMGAAIAASAADAERHHHRHHGHDEVHVTEVHYEAPPPPPAAPPSGLNVAEARAELAEAELWAQRNCEPEVEQPSGVAVWVTYRGSDGRSINAHFDPPLRGEGFSQCMQGAFLRQQVTPFVGDDVIIRKSLGG